MLSRDITIEYDYDRTIFDAFSNEYRDYLESEQYIEASDEEFKRLYAQLSELHSQLLIVKATWGIELYEEVFGLTKPNGDEVSIEERRRRILAILAGTGTSTIANLEHMLNQLTGIVGAEIEEHNSEYYFNVTIPADDMFILTEAARLLDIYKPAHLAYIITTYRKDSLYLASVQLSGEDTTLFPATFEDIEVVAVNKKASGSYTQEITVIHPQ